MEFLPDLSLIQAVGFSHDLGHPPFGHGGEVALNYCMTGRGGFEGNGANLSRRALLGILKYPVPFSRAENLGRKPELIAGPTTLKLINREKSKPPKCYLDCEQLIVHWILAPLSVPDRDLFTSCKKEADKHNKPLHKSFDCSIMDLA